MKGADHYVGAESGMILAALFPSISANRMNASLFIFLFRLRLILIKGRNVFHFGQLRKCNEKQTCQNGIR